MSEVYHGAIIPGPLQDVQVAFESSPSKLTLRLVSFSNAVQGVYCQRVLGSNQHVLAELSRLAGRYSATLEFSILYFYDSCTGFDFAWFEGGRQTKASRHRDGYAVFDRSGQLPEFEEPFAVLGRLGLDDEQVENAFRWNQLEAVVHNQPEWELAKGRYPVGSQVQGRVREHYKNSGVVIDLDDSVARGFVDSAAYGESPGIATDNFPEVGRDLPLVVEEYSDEWLKTVFLKPLDRSVGGCRL